ncbi:hypothetical protein H9P43_007005 [Blastocladiella emersonii ATCC 22665]|nr:hypothetical protein H9P43_007005 [Blastocladiella emersonii ATCC 22665]
MKTTALIAAIAVASTAVASVDAAAQPAFSGRVSHSSVLAPSTLVRRDRTTHYSPGVGLGACGKQNSDSEMVVALNRAQFDTMTPNGNPNKNAYCNSCVQLSNGAKTAMAQIVDSCPGCPSGGLDVSPSLFQVFADLGVGVLDLQWRFAPCGGAAVAETAAVTVAAAAPAVDTNAQAEAAAQAKAAADRAAKAKADEERAAQEKAAAERAAQAKSDEERAAQEKAAAERAAQAKADEERAAQAKSDEERAAQERAAAAKADEERNAQAKADAENQARKEAEEAAARAAAARSNEPVSTPSPTPSPVDDVTVLGTPVFDNGVVATATTAATATATSTAIPSIDNWRSHGAEGWYRHRVAEDMSLPAKADDETITTASNDDVEKAAAEHKAAYNERVKYMEALFRMIFQRLAGKSE